MKSRCKNSATDCLENFSRPCLNENDAINRALSEAKRAVLDEYSTKLESNDRLLSLALKEAEALAWQTDYPHLVFPTLATEKAQAALAWHRHQSKIQRDVAFAA